MSNRLFLAVIAGLQSKHGVIMCKDISLGLRNMIYY